ncbi:MAG: hypothetical protein ACYS9Y_15220, partial [Planctomycetota bacterium]
VRGGTYVGSISTSSGNINKWIAYPGESPTIDLNQGSNITVRNSYALIDGFELKNAPTKAFFVYDNVGHLIVRRNHMHHLYDASDRGNPSFIFFPNATWHDYNVFQDNLFHDLFDADHNHGASVIYYDVRYSLYEDNEAYNFDGRCAADKDDGYYNTFRNNVFHGSGAGLTLSNQQTQEEIDVCYNLVYNTGTAIKIGGQPGYIRDIYVHHNTFTDSVTFRWVIAEPGSDEINVYNNIITNGDSWLYALEPDAEDAVLADDRVHVDDNLLWTTGSYVAGWSWGTTLRTFSEWQGYGKDLNGILDDPQLDGNYNLPPDSPYLGIYGRQIVTGPQPPGQASNPSPGNGATNVSVDADLNWSAGSGATSHDVYFGTDSTPDAGEFQGNQTATTYEPGTMANDATYYWRIDEINAEGTTTGNVWNFTTEAAPQPPGQASNPNPADSTTDVSVDADLSWTAGTGSTSSDVYFGTDSTPDAGEFQGNQTATTYEPGTMSFSTTYYWRIDEINAQGTTAGNVWSFTTEASPPPPGQASNPSPANSATDVSITADLSWTAGSNTTSHDVYFGTSSPGTFQGNQTATTYDAGTMAESTTYYWRIDELNAVGTTTGNVWSFTTGTAPPAFLQDSGADGIVSMEAENYDVYTQQGAHSWISVTTPSGYTGTAAMNTTPNDGTNQNTGYAANSPRLDFQVD